MVSLNEIFEFSISQQLSKLKQFIEGQNSLGNLQGLFCHYLLSNVQGFELSWKVICNADWIHNTLQKNNAHHLAALGYSLYSDSSLENTEFVRGLCMLSQRQSALESHISWPYQPCTVTGLVLGLKALPADKKDTNLVPWLMEIIENTLSSGQLSVFNELFYRYLKFHLGYHVSDAEYKKCSTLEELAFLEIGIIEGAFSLKTKQEADELKRDFMLRLLETEPTYPDAEKAGVIWKAIHDTIIQSLSNPLSPFYDLVLILSRFQDAMKRWRYDTEDKKTSIIWPVNHEKEVQDIVWLILRPFFVDLVDEETLPKFGHSSHKPDFAIPSQRVLIEVKFAYNKEDFRRIEKEVMIDSTGYLTNTDSYDKLIIFIYDDSCSIQEHNTTIAALKKIREVEEVIIASRPSQIPSPENRIKI